MNKKGSLMDKKIIDPLFYYLIQDFILVIFLMAITIKKLESNWTIISSIWQICIISFSILIVNTWNWGDASFMERPKTREGNIYLIFGAIIIVSILTRMALLAPVAIAISQIGGPLIYYHKEMTRRHYLEIILIILVCAFIQYVVIVGGWY